MIFLYTLLCSSHTHTALVGLRKYTRTTPVKITADKVEIHCLKLKQLVMLRDRIIAGPKKKSPQFRRRPRKVTVAPAGTVPAAISKVSPYFFHALAS